MINPVYHDHHENCPYCNSEDTLELYDKTNRPCGYSDILNTHNLDITKSRSIRYFKCNKCKETFKIDWTWCVPIPLNESKIDDFISICRKVKGK